MNSGSLGHGLPVCVGMAKASKMDKRGNRVYVVMGDGELAEGSVWEGVMAARQYRLDNLCAVVDRNRLQISGNTEDIMGHDDLYARFGSFGWNVIDVSDGNDIDLLRDAFEAAKKHKDAPSVIIANTVKGKGSPVMEGKVDWHHRVPTDEEYVATKALLLNESGKLLGRTDIQHRQIVNKDGRVSHSPEEIYENTVKAARLLIEQSGIDKREIACMGISNQRETSLAWDKETGKPVCDAIVWQCSRSADICDEVEKLGYGELIRQKTGIKLSPYFPASKLAWILRNIDGTLEKAKNRQLCYGTIDTWLIYKLTNGREYKTDYSNASRTQLFNIYDLKWDGEICDIFGINKSDLAEVCDSDSDFGATTLGEYLDEPIPIHGVLGDSHGALFGH